MLITTTVPKQQSEPFAKLEKKNIFRYSIFRYTIKSTQFGKIEFSKDFVENIFFF